MRTTTICLICKPPIDPAPPQVLPYSRHTPSHISRVPPHDPEQSTTQSFAGVVSQTPHMSILFGPSAIP